VFAILNEEGIVPDDLLAELTNMVGFRNLIVHDYARIDDQLVYSIMQDHVDDFTRFAAAVTTFLASLG
jgi:uncharacterized protein YutE (UPF0331/DUF86 family)